MQKVRICELKSQDLPLRIRFEGPHGKKDYMLIQTKQGKLLLNKPVEAQESENQ